MQPHRRRRREEDGGGGRRRRRGNSQEVEVTGGRHPQEVELPEEWNSRGWPRGWNAQGGGTPRGWKSQGGGTPRGQEGGTPRGWNPQEGISVCWALEDTSANSHEGIYIYIDNLLLFIQCKEISANAQICTEGKGFCLKCEAYFWHRS